MIRSVPPLLIALTASVLWAGLASAATYYIDFANGDDSAAGRSPESAWKHAPGDSNATGGPAAAKLEPGDTLLFKGGVAYRGSIRISVSGAAGKPITLDGNTAGTFGQGRAILDGGTVIENWQRVQSPEDAGGNARWQEIFFADIDMDLSSNFQHGEFVVHRQVPPDRQAPWQRLILFDGESGLLPIAQFPKPSDVFYPDIPRDFQISPHRLEIDKDKGITRLKDEEKLAGRDSGWYDGMFIGVHGGNNHVYFAVIKSYDPEARQLTLPEFKPSTYDQTRYVFYNSVRLIEQPGEWSVTPLENGRSRVYLLPGRVEEGRPVNVGYPTLDGAVTMESGASHLAVRGFLIQRYAGGSGGVSVSRSSGRSRDIAIADCEIRYLAGHAGIGLNFCDEITVENNYIHHNPAWTSGIFLSRVNHYTVNNNHLDKNSGSGIRHYECKDGVVRDNAILDHFGMHSSAINVYEGCANLVLERNYLQNTATINRNAENIVFRNNVIDGLGRSSTALGMWSSGSVGGRDFKDVHFLNNTFVNLNHDVAWSTGILGQRKKGVSSPQGLVIRGNILDRITQDLPGEIENNIYTRPVEERFMGGSNQVVTDLSALFMDPSKGDFRRRPGGPAMDAGADIPPPAVRAKPAN